MRNIERRRAEERRVADLTRFSRDTRWYSHVAEKQTKVEEIRAAKLEAARIDEEKQRRLLAEKKEALRRDMAAREVEELAARELHGRRMEAEKKQREMQRVLESSEELKDLERRIKTAYVNKERAAQFQEKLLLRRLDLDREQVSRS